MVFQRFGKWLLTDAGKKFSFYTASIGSSGVMLAHFLPHTILLDYYKNVIQFYRKGMTVPLTKDLKQRFQKTLELLEVEPIDQHLYKPFYVCGFDVMSAGSSRSRFGVIIGLPFSFQYDNVDTASDKPVISVRDKQLSWGSENGKKLLESLILSENAQMYAMAREIKIRQSWKLGFDVIYGTTSAALIYGVANQLNNSFNMYSKPRSVRLVMYTLIASFFTTTYFMLKDITTVTLEKKIDKVLKETNPIFKEGGKEYYTKVIERNKILREVLGSKGESVYTALGNENSFIRTKHIPNVQRKAFFEDNSPSDSIYA